MDFTSIRSSLGPGFGVGRYVTSRAEPFEGRMAARCWPEGAEVPATSSLILLTMEDILGLVSGLVAFLVGCDR